MEKEKPYTRRENFYFQNNSNIKKCFPIIYSLTVPKHIVNELEKIQKDFLGKNCTPKIKYETLYTDYKAGGLKNVDIPNKIITLQCSWIEGFTIIISMNGS